MADKTWKRFERLVCTALGGTRTGPRGFGLPDCTGVPIAVECKSDAVANLETAHIEQAEANAKGVDLPWVLVYKNLRGRKLAVMEFSTLVDLVKEKYV